MSALDWLLLAIMAISALLGVMRGLVGVIASLAAWVLAGWAAFHFGGEVARMLGGIVPPAAQMISGYAVCFVLVMVVVTVVGWIVRMSVHSMGLSGVDRGLGLIFGVVRGAFICCVVLVLLAFTTLPRERAWRASATVPVFEPGARWLRGWLPDWVAQQVDFSRGGPISVRPQGLPSLDSLSSLPNALPTSLPASLPKGVLPDNMFSGGGLSGAGLSGTGLSGAGLPGQLFPSAGQTKPQPTRDPLNADVANGAKNEPDPKRVH